MSAYYNEHDPHAAQWLRNLIAAGEIAPGEVDETDVRDVAPDRLANFTQLHFFAGIGVWSYALRRAGWPDDRPVWTGSCPCQSFSAAGAGKGFADERHLWPAWFHLIGERRPPIILGEQVGDAVKHGWLDLVQSDLEGIDYAIGAVNFPSAGVGAPHRRQRLWFVANANGGESIGGQLRQFAQDGCAVRLVDSESIGLQRRQDDRDDGRRQCASGQGCEARELEHAAGDGRDEGRPASSERGSIGGRGDGGVVKSIGARLEGHGGDGDDRGQPGWIDPQPHGPTSSTGSVVRPGPVNGFWRDADWIGCTDGKWRPVEPESFPLVDGASFRLGSGGPFEGKTRAKMLKGYGNAINAQAARAFVEAYLETEESL